VSPKGLVVASSARAARVTLWSVAVAACALLPVAPPLAAQGASPAAVSGAVTDEGNRPLEGVRVVADDGQVIETDASGRFSLRARECGPLRLTVRRPGSVSVTRVVDPCAAGGASPLALVLRPVSQRLDTVQVRSRVSGVIGTVTDRTGTPLPNVEIALLGARPPVRTDAQGRFSILGVDPGAYLLRAREPRFEAQQLSMGLQQGDVREVQLLMWPLPDNASGRKQRDLSGYGIDDWWYRDLGRRRAWRGAFSVLASREELLATGERDLPCAVSRVPRTQQVFMRLTSGTCANWSPPVGCVIVDGRWDFPQPLWAIRTRDVELVELYQPRSDFTASTLVRANQCPPGQPVAVVWSH
jgi:hypothetical protein